MHSIGPGTTVKPEKNDRRLEYRTLAQGLPAGHCSSKPPSPPSHILQLFSSHLSIPSMDGFDEDDLPTK